MVSWISYIIGICCIIWALMQARTALVYMGVLRSAVIETSSSGLIHSAMQDAISFFVFGLLVFIFPWPNIVTYILFALLLKSIVNLLLAYLRVGLYQMVDLTERGNTQRVLRETIPVLIYSGAALAPVRFLGW